MPRNTRKGTYPNLPPPAKRQTRSLSTSHGRVATTAENRQTKDDSLPSDDAINQTLDKVRAGTSSDISAATIADGRNVSEATHHADCNEMSMATLHADRNEMSASASNNVNPNDVPNNAADLNDDAAANNVPNAIAPINVCNDDARSREDVRKSASSAASRKVISIATESTIRNDVGAAAVLALHDDTDDEEDDVNIPVASIVRQFPPSRKCICKSHSGDTRGCPVHHYNAIWDEHLSIDGENGPLKTAEDDDVLQCFLLRLPTFLGTKIRMDGVNFGNSRLRFIRC